MKLVFHMLVTLTIIGIISGALLSEINSWAAPKIEANRKAETERAIFVVQSNATKYNKIEDVDFELYEVFDDNDSSLGYALPYEGNGFQGKIRLIVGINKDLTNLLGLEVLEQVETPGLGTKVTELPFTNQFEELLVNPEILSVKGIEPQKPNEIQAITGATISSKAIVRIINDGIKRLRLENNNEAVK
jgi:H+/Na+-translocating ferredoxin:NAD+ oxidoreductase subunit G